MSSVFRLTEAQPFSPQEYCNLRVLGPDVVVLWARRNEIQSLLLLLIKKFKTRSTPTHPHTHTRTAFYNHQRKKEKMRSDNIDIANEIATMIICRDGKIPPASKYIMESLYHFGLPASSDSKKGDQMCQICSIGEDEDDDCDGEQQQPHDEGCGGCCGSKKPAPGAATILMTKLPCGHVYHTACIDLWFKRCCTCPTCRYELPTDDMIYEFSREIKMANYYKIAYQNEKQVLLSSSSSTTPQQDDEEEEMEVTVVWELQQNGRRQSVIENLDYTTSTLQQRTY